MSLNKEELVKEWLDKGKYLSDYIRCKKSFIAGYEAAEPKWYYTKDKLPEEDVPVLCDVTNTGIPDILNYTVLRFYQGHWYGDIMPDEYVERWQNIAK